MGLTRPRINQLNTNITSIADPLLVLNKSSTTANIDVGFIFNRDGGASANAAIIWSESANAFVLALTTASGVNNANISVSSYANLQVGSFTVSETLNTSSLAITANTQSDNVSTGAITVAGGVGISGNLNAGNVRATSFTYSNGQSILDNVMSAWQANAGAQAGDIATLFANAGAQAGDISNLYNIKANLASPTFSGNVNISGNLFVSGNMTVYNTNNVSLTDGMIYLADGNSGNVIDLGMVVAWNDGTYQHGGFVRDATDGVWKLFGNVVPEPTTTVDFANIRYQDMRAGNVTVSSIGGDTGSLSVVGNLQLLSAPLAAIYGGTGQTGYTAGDLLYATSSTTLAKLPAGGANQVLQIHANAVPYWGDIDGGTY